MDTRADARTGPPTGGSTDASCVHHLVEEQARLRPDAVAVSMDGTTLTYRELDAWAGRIAGALLASGVAPQAGVVVAVPRSLAYPAAVLGVLKAAGAYVPLDRDYPAERRSFILRDSGAGAVLTTGDDPDLDGYGVPAITVEDLGPDGVVGGGEDRAETVAVPGAGSTDAAYVIYTSGSTGTPKGVVVEHRHVLSLVRDDERLHVQPGDRVALFAPLAFDASTFELWNTLCRGGVLTVLTSGRESVADLGKQLRDVQPQWLFLTSGLFHLLVEYDPEALDHVGCLITGGDVLSVRHFRAAASRGTARVYAAYGPTETTCFASLHRAEADREYMRVPLGSPLLGTDFHILDEQRRPVPAGEVGEIWISGTGVARGYHERAELTAERFLTVEESASRQYRTGDLGRELPDGQYEFHGRIDRQVKIRGFRIEPGEIESVLSTHPTVSAVAVAAVEDPVDGRRLAAYIVPTPGHVVNARELRAWVGEHLPSHMEPASFVELEEMPLDANGKPDRSPARLPQPWTERDQLEGMPAYRGPGSETERTIAAAWAGSLGLDRVGLDDDFEALGGDSLHSVDILARLRNEGLTVSALDFFRSPTVGELAAVCAESGR